MPRESQKKISKLAVISLIFCSLGMANLVLHLLTMKIHAVAFWTMSLPLIFVLVIFGFLGLPPTLYIFICLTIVFGLVAIMKIRKDPNLKGKKLALMSLVIGLFMALFYIYVILSWEFPMEGG